MTSRVARMEAAVPVRDGDDGDDCGRPASTPLSGAAPADGDEVGADPVLIGPPGAGAAVPVADEGVCCGATNVPVLHPHNPALSKTNAVPWARARCSISVRIAVKDDPGFCGAKKKGAPVSLLRSEKPRR